MNTVTNEIALCWWFQIKIPSNARELGNGRNAGFEPRVSDTYSPAEWITADKPTELSRIKLKNLNTTQYIYIYMCVCVYLTLVTSACYKQDLATTKHMLFGAVCILTMLGMTRWWSVLCRPFDEMTKCSPNSIFYFFLFFLSVSFFCGKIDIYYSCSWSPENWNWGVVNCKCTAKITEKDICIR